jgi:hypothetical protein
LSRPARERAWTAAARLQAVITTAAMEEAERNAWCREQVSTFSLFDGTVSRFFEVVPESGSGLFLERTGTGTGNRLLGRV